MLKYGKLWQRTNIKSVHLGKDLDVPSYVCLQIVFSYFWVKTENQNVWLKKKLAHKIMIFIIKRQMKHLILSSLKSKTEVNSCLSKRLYEDQKDIVFIEWHLKEI